MAAVTSTAQSLAQASLTSTTRSGDSGSLKQRSNAKLNGPTLSRLSSARLMSVSAFHGATFAPLSEHVAAQKANPGQARRGVVQASRDSDVELNKGQERSREMLEGQSNNADLDFKTLVYVLLGLGFAAFSYAQIAYTQDYYTQGLGVAPETSSQYSFVRSYGTSLIPLSLYSFYSAFQKTSAATGARLNFALFVYGAAYGIPVLLGYLDKVVPQPYTATALVLCGVAAIFPPIFSGLDVVNVVSGVQDGVKKVFKIEGTLSFFTLVTTIIFFGQGLAIYAAPTKILPPDLLAGAARDAVIVFARGVSAASFGASITAATIKDIADNNKVEERQAFVTMNLGLILMSGGMLAVAYFNSLEPTGLLATSPEYFYLRVGVSTFNILVLLANVFFGAK